MRISIADLNKKSRTCEVGKSYSKYNAKKMALDGIVFDSKKEAERYAELRLLERGGSISDLELQPVFVLQEPFEYQGHKFRGIKYIADFRYNEQGSCIVEDVKGKKTDVYALKKKLFLAKYGPAIIFREV